MSFTLLWTDVAAIVTIVTTICATLSGLLARSFKKEMRTFKSELLLELDKRYLTLDAHRLHQERDDREHAEMRDRVKFLERIILKPVAALRDTGDDQ